MTDYKNLLNEALSYNIKNYKENDCFDMNESINNTNEASKENISLYNSLVHYISGYCNYNMKLSNGVKLDIAEQQDTDNIDILVNKTKPINKPLYLFHGFEFGTNYQDHKWVIGQNLEFNFHLSKTPAYWIAKNFTNHFNCHINSRIYYFNVSFYESFKSIFIRKYLFCIYEELGKWKHVSTDIRCPKSLLEKNPKLILNEEFEYEFRIFF
jgi:hypothetical protein